jgi:hypothetical protein
MILCFVGKKCEIKNEKTKLSEPNRCNFLRGNNIGKKTVSPSPILPPASFHRFAVEQNSDEKFEYFIYRKKFAHVIFFVNLRKLKTVNYDKRINM